MGVHRLRLSIDDSPLGGSESRLVVTILVDEKEVFDRLGDQRYWGWHPARILNPDRSPLLPARPPRRVGLYPRADEFYVGDGCVTALVEDRSDLVLWADLSFFDGYQEPIMDPEPSPRYGALIGIPDMAFDAVQYREEVARATAERWWETPELTTVRLLDARLRGRERYLAELGWKVSFAERGRHGYRVVLRDGGDGDIVIELADQPGSPEDQAAAMAAMLLDMPPQRWPVVHCNLCDRASDGNDEKEDDWLGRMRAKHPAHGRKNT